MAGFERAVQELYQAPLAQFVAERKRLAGELKKDGDAPAAKDLLTRKRPTISAWVVNQLYWHARDAFDHLMETAGRLRKGDLRASTEHRDTISELRKRAAALLEEAGHSATEATLRRVTMTLSALAASGGFYPDPPGALAEDRDPPGFEAIGIPSGPIEDSEPAPHRPKAAKHAAAKHAKHAHDGHDELAAARAAAEKKRAQEMEEKRHAEAERKRRAEERHRLEAALRNAKAERTDKERAVKQLEKELDHAQKQVEKAQALVDELEAKLGDGHN